MKICLLSGSFYPRVGGAETYARTIAESMARAGHNIIIAADGTGSDAFQPDHLGPIRILRTSAYLPELINPDNQPWRQMCFGVINELRSLLEGYQIDIVHANLIDSAVIGSMLALERKVPLVCSFHEVQPEKEWAGEGGCRFVFSQLPVDAFLAGSQFYFDKACTYGAQEEKVHLIYHGVDMTRFAPRPLADAQSIRSKLGVDQQDFFLVCVARLKERKGLLELVHALSLARKTVPTIRGLIAGSCNSASRGYADLLALEIQKLGLSDVVRTAEEMAYEDMPDLYTAADLVVQPSYAEGLGIALLEAMSSGKPVIGTTVTGIEEIITHEQDGLLVPPGSVQLLAEAIVRIATDRDLALRLAEAGRERVRSNFTLDRSIQETERVYEKVLGLYQGW